MAAVSQHKELLRPADAGDPSLRSRQILRGVVALDARGESFFAKLSRQVLRVLARESGL